MRSPAVRTSSRRNSAARCGPTPRTNSTGVASTSASVGLRAGAGCDPADGVMPLMPSLYGERNAVAGWVERDRHDMRELAVRNSTHPTSTADTPPRPVHRRGRFPRGRCGRRRACTSPRAWPMSSSSLRHKSSLAIGTSLLPFLPPPAVGLPLRQPFADPFADVHAVGEQLDVAAALERPQALAPRPSAPSCCSSSPARRPTAPAPCPTPDGAR